MKFEELFDQRSIVAMKLKDSFLEQVERAGISTKELLKDYDAILIPTGFQKKSVIRFIGRTI